MVYEYYNNLFFFKILYNLLDIIELTFIFSEISFISLLPSEYCKKSNNFSEYSPYTLFERFG